VEGAATGVGDQSDAAKQAEGNQSDADVADDGVLSGGENSVTRIKKISTPERPVWLHG
jgi:hypothetical protein